MLLFCKLHKKSQSAKDQAEFFKQRNLVMSNSHLVTLTGKVRYLNITHTRCSLYCLAPCTSGLPAHDSIRHILVIFNPIQSAYRNAITN